MTQEQYAWQQECLALWEKNQYHGIVQAVTGAGKTRMAVEAVRRLYKAEGEKLKVKIVVPGKSLLLQWKHILEEALPKMSEGKTESESSIGVCGGGFTGRDNWFCMLYVINSARYRLARRVLQELREGYTVLLIADECHHYASGENRKIFDFLPFVEDVRGRYCSLGLSATPQVQGYDSVLVPALGKKIYDYSFAHALKRGTVCDFAIWQIAVSFTTREEKEYEEATDNIKRIRTALLHRCPELKYCEGTEFFARLQMLAGEVNREEAGLARSYFKQVYKRKRIVYMAQARTECVCRLLNCIGESEKIIIFGESIVQIELLYERLAKMYPGRIGRYHSKMGECANKNTLERFRTGSNRILLTCRALDEGIDVPEASVGIILSGTAMERQRLQRLGRILRRSDDKRIACLYYLFVADSKEERAYFPEKTESFRIENLFFDSREGEFTYPDYDKAASRLLRKTEKMYSADAVYGEILECLERGRLRGDWLLSPAECLKMAEKAANTRERNYWICMGQMAKQKRKRCFEGEDRI